MKDQDVYVSARNVADLLGITPQTLRKWRREGKLSEKDIQAVKRNRRWYFKASDIAEILNDLD